MIKGGKQKKTTYNLIKYVLIHIIVILREVFMIVELVIF
jgi:hypothetical protein